VSCLLCCVSAALGVNDLNQRRVWLTIVFDAAIYLFSAAYHLYFLHVCINASRRLIRSRDDYVADVSAASRSQSDSSLHWRRALQQGQDRGKLALTSVDDMSRRTITTVNPMARMIKGFSGRDTPRLNGRVGLLHGHGPSSSDMNA